MGCNRGAQESVSKTLPRHGIGLLQEAFGAIQAAVVERYHTLQQIVIGVILDILRSLGAEVDRHEQAERAEATARREDELV